MKNALSLLAATTKNPAGLRLGGAGFGALTCWPYFGFRFRPFGQPPFLALALAAAVFASEVFRPPSLPSACAALFIVGLIFGGVEDLGLDRGAGFVPGIPSPVGASPHEAVFVGGNKGQERAEKVDDFFLRAACGLLEIPVIQVLLPVVFGKAKVGEITAGGCGGVFHNAHTIPKRLGIVNKKNARIENIFWQNTKVTESP